MESLGNFYPAKRRCPLTLVSTAYWVTEEVGALHKGVAVDNLVLLATCWTSNRREMPSGSACRIEIPLAGAWLGKWPPKFGSGSSGEARSLIGWRAGMKIGSCDLVDSVSQNRRVNAFWLRGEYGERSN